MVNLFLYENHIRLFIGTIVLIFAAFSQLWWLVIIGIFLFIPVCFEIRNEFRDDTMFESE